MTVDEMSKRAVEIRELYSRYETNRVGKSWTKSQIMEGFVVDVGDLMRLVMAKEGARTVENMDEKLAHELADCLWCVLVLADKYGVDIEKEFVGTMNMLEEKVSAEM
jgi:NTP pyrophosphatase (non-canonical NTP hydrolase)